MLIAWDAVLLAALLAAGLALVLLLGVSRLGSGLSRQQVAGLALCAGLGLILWFGIFNLFSLGWLDFDFPIPLFPVSPEDLSCMVVTALVTFFYWGFFRTALRKQVFTTASASTLTEPAWWIWTLPALAALIVDVYFI